MDIDKVHGVLLDAGLPSTIEDLKNPTAEYAVNLFTAFLLRYNINMSLIDQPSSEQHSVMTHFEDSDTINLINLHAVLAQIFDKIFLNDFCITDITAPVPKRLRKQAKFLANFVLYTMVKQSECNDRKDKIRNVHKSLEELKEKRAEVLESINNKALYKTEQLSLIKKLKNEIQQVQMRIEEINKKESGLDKVQISVEKERQKAKEVCSSAKIRAGKLSKKIADLRSEIVHSPEEYRERLKDLEKQANLKVEERDVMQEAIQDKKQTIKDIEEKLNFVQKMSNELAPLKSIHEQLKSQKAQSNSIKNQLDLLNNKWKELENELAMHKDEVKTEMNELQSHREETIIPLNNTCAQLLSEKKLAIAKLEAEKAIFNEKYLEKNKLEEEIKKIGEETAIFIQNCQQLYDNEIAEEEELRKTWKEGSL